jgi:flagellar hook-associated protein 2
MFGAAPTSIDGLDVTGTIGGTMAIGSGQTLTGAGNAAGLSIVVSGGVTGDRGIIAFSRGYANQVDTLLDDVLASSGVLESATDGINDRIKDIGDDRDALARRLEIVEQRLFRQFNALDLLVSNLQSTSAFLTNQLAALPVIGSDNGSNQ